MIPTLQIKPMSVNQVWQGRRFKTKGYKEYEARMLRIMPDMQIPEGKLSVVITFGFSNIQSDVDNPVKPFLDCLQKRYGFNDSMIWKLELTKQKVKKGSEFITYAIDSIHGSDSLVE